jgi:hypothetical protein
VDAMVSAGVLQEQISPESENGWQFVDKSVSHTFGNGTMNELIFVKK